MTGIRAQGLEDVCEGLEGATCGCRVCEDSEA